MCVRRKGRHIAEGLKLSGSYFIPSPNTHNGEKFNPLGPIYRVIRNDCRGFNNLSYTIHFR